MIYIHHAKAYGRNNPPTIRFIAKEINRSTSTTHEHLNQLMEAGVLSHNDNNRFVINKEYLDDEEEYTTDEAIAIIREGDAPASPRFVRAVQKVCNLLQSGYTITPERNEDN